MKEDDFDIFDNVVYIDAGDNHLKLGMNYNVFMQFTNDISELFSVV